MAWNSENIGKREQNGGWLPFTASTIICYWHMKFPRMWDTCGFAPHFPHLWAKWYFSSNLHFNCWYLVFKFSATLHGCAKLSVRKMHTCLKKVYNELGVFVFMFSMWCNKDGGKIYNRRLHDSNIDMWITVHIGRWLSKPRCASPAIYINIAVIYIWTGAWRRWRSASQRKLAMPQ